MKCKCCGLEYYELTCQVCGRSFTSRVKNRVLCDKHDRTAYHAKYYRDNKKYKDGKSKEGMRRYRQRRKKSGGEINEYNKEIIETWNTRAEGKVGEPAT